MKKMLLPLLVLAFSAFAFAGSVTINFEQYPEFTQITNQYSAADGVNFTNALQLVAPNYDYFDYPPHSGNGVITNDPNSPLTMVFTPGSAPYSLNGWFSSPSGITAMAFDSHGNLLATFTGSTNQSNAPFLLNGGTYISYVTFDDAIGPDGLTLDDLTWTPVPEPGMPMVMSTGLLAGFGISFWRRKLSLRRKLGS
jgi:hypothetical protein